LTSPIRAARLARRGFCAGALSLAGGLAGLVAAPPARADEKPSEWARELGQIEHQVQGQLGVFILDTGTGTGFGWRVGQRFAMCSSFKLSLAALVLRQIAAGRLRSSQRLKIAKTDLLPNSPRTTPLAGRSMTVLDLAEAAVVVSDNTAANLLLRRVGGPAGLTAFWRAIGDDVSSLDDFEPALNRVPEGEVRNTSSPRAMAGTVAKLLSPGVLSPDGRDRLLGWMHASETGGSRLRAGLPKDWWAGDKTGTGLSIDLPATYVDLAFVRPPQGAPIVVAAFLRTLAPQVEIDPGTEVALARVGALAARWAQARATSPA
jgi:beta-lactamase class A